jgi:hypothetical protein
MAVFTSVFRNWFLRACLTWLQRKTPGGLDKSQSNTSLQSWQLREVFEAIVHFYTLFTTLKSLKINIGIEFLFTHNYR